MGAHNRLVDRKMPAEITLHPGRGRPERVPHDADEVELIDGAGPPNEIPEMRSRSRNETGEDLGSVCGLPPPSIGEPGRGGEVVERHDGGDAALAAGRADTAVVLECCKRKLAFGGLDAAPLERESGRMETHGGHELNVFGPAVQGITRVATRRGASRVGVMFPSPPVVVDVAALDLMS